MTVELQETLVKVDTALLLKEIGFNLPVWNYFYKAVPESTFNEGYLQYKNNYNAVNTVAITLSRPSQHLAFKWLMKEHGVHIKIDSYYTNSKLRFDYYIKEVGTQDEENIVGELESYEDAMEVAIQDACKNIINLKSRKIND